MTTSDDTRRLVTLAATLHELKRYAEAAACWEKALALEPGNANVHNNLGVSLAALNRDAEAIACHEAALAIDPNYPEAEFNRSLGLLRSGNFRAGWSAYEKRWQAKVGIGTGHVDRPLWLGREPIAGRKLLVEFEQGFGDAIQALRYVPLLEGLGAQCWIHALASLLSLVQRSFPRSTVIARNWWPHEIELRIPVMSLPLAMQTFAESDIPRVVPYLVADEGRKAHWAALLADPGRPRVGLAWRGNPGHRNERNRSARLEDLVPLLSRTDVRFVTLQKDLSAAERKILAAHPNVTVLDAELETFDDTAAVACNLEAVVSVDSSPAHLAGALGRPVWVMLPCSPEWRWGLERSDSPWYPQARLFRQAAPGDWNSVIDAVDGALAALRAG